MPTPPGYWAAERLTAFANCEITEANWRTLWTGLRGRGFRPARHPRETAARPGFVPEDLCNAIQSSIVIARAPREFPPREWEVLDAQRHVATLKAMRLPAADAIVHRLTPNGP